MPRRQLLSIILALIMSPAFLPAAPAPDLAFSPPEWKFGMIIQGTVIEQELTVTNREPVGLTVSLLPTCSCNQVIPGSRTIPAGSSAVFLMRYDSIDDRGVTTKSFLVKTDLPGTSPLYYWIRGTVRESNQAALESNQAAPAGGAWTRQAPAPDASGAAAGPAATGPAAVGPAAVGSGTPLALTYYYTPGCRSCEEFLSVEIPRLEKSIGRKITVSRRDLLDNRQFEELSAFAAARGQALNAIPVLRAGDALLQGDAAIREKLPALLESLATGRAGPASTDVSPAAVTVTERLAVLTVIAGGLVDGINPCAFTTLIFLLASLTLAGRGRREVLVIGSLFSLAVFLSYFLIGLGLFTALRAAAAVSLVSVLLRWVLVGVLLVFAGLSMYDYSRIRAGHPTEMLLQLPASFKKRIHATIRTRVRVAALAGSSLVLGFLVSIFEFACTGQVYLPVLGSLARMQQRLDGFGLLALYNFCFIVPLLVVFGVSYLGVSSGRITSFFQAHMGLVKVSLAVFFVGLAVFTLVG